MYTSQMIAAVLNRDRKERASHEAFQPIAEHIGMEADPEEHPAKERWTYTAQSADGRLYSFNGRVSQRVSATGERTRSFAVSI